MNVNSFNALLGAVETEESLKGSDFTIFIFKTEWEIINKIRQLLIDFRRIYICFSFFTSQFFEIKRFVKRIKQVYKSRVYLIAGGPHPTGDPEGTLKIGFNIVISGEGEESFVELIAHLANNSEIRHIKGISYNDENGEYQFTGKRPAMNLDKYPSFPTKQYRRFGSIEITRGCPYACFFCQTSHLFGTRPRHRSIESIVEHVQWLVEQFQESTYIRFISPSALSYGSSDGKTINIDKIGELLTVIDDILPPKGRLFFGSFPTEVRPDHVNKATMQLISRFASNDNIVIGAQSGSQKVLDDCNRGHNVDDVYKAVDLIIESNFKPYVDFIFGLPNETEEDMTQSIKVMKDLVRKGAKIHAHAFMPLPQTVFAKSSPQRIKKKLRIVIETLTSNGDLFGSWKKHERFALKSSKLFIS